MRKFIALALLVAFAVPVLLAAVPDREEQWKKVDEAVSKGLPKTAIAELEPIIMSAIKAKAFPEAIRAVALKISLEGNIQGNKPEEKITRLEKAIADSPRQMKPVLNAILANWYWHYFQQNRYRILQRTATASAPGNDFTSWDLPRLLSEIDKQFTVTLALADSLKDVPVADYQDLLTPGTMPDTFRPTMYDFVVYNALGFYSSGEQAGSRAQDAFDLMADSPVFGSSKEFLDWKIETSDEDSLTVKAITLHQDLMRFHQDDKDKAAWIDADLARLMFGYNKAFGETKNERYKAALTRLVDDWGDHRIAARALYQWARVLHQEGDWVEAGQLLAVLSNPSLQAGADMADVASAVHNEDRLHHRTSLPSYYLLTMRAELIGHFEPCMTEIYLHIVARMARSRLHAFARFAADAHGPLIRSLISWPPPSSP